jgi:hypothetical protein
MFRLRGSRLSYITAGAPGGDREFGVAGSLNSGPPALVQISNPNSAVC